MSSATNMNIYLNNHYEGMTPEKLIQMLYRGALRNLSLAREGINENNPRKRGEHLSKTIAIVSELYSSLNPEMTDESTQFLRGLYSNMLVELPKISISNDIKTLDLAYSYLERLDQIWKQEVMGKNHVKQFSETESNEHDRNKNTKKKIKKIGNPGNTDNRYGNGYSGMESRLIAQSIFA